MNVVLIGVLSSSSGFKTGSRFGSVFAGGGGLSVDVESVWIDPIATSGVGDGVIPGMTASTPVGGGGGTSGAVGASVEPGTKGAGATYPLCSGVEVGVPCGSVAVGPIYATDYEKHCKKSRKNF